MCQILRFTFRLSDQAAPLVPHVVNEVGQNNRDEQEGGEGDHALHTTGRHRLWPRFQGGTFDGVHSYEQVQQERGYRDEGPALVGLKARKHRCIGDEQCQHVVRGENPDRTEHRVGQTDFQRETPN